MPSLKQILVTASLCLGAPATTLFAHSAEIKIAFLGDSLTEGYGVPAEAAYPSVIEKKLKNQGKNIRAINSGVSGSTSASAVSRVKWILKAKPDWIILALGANDALRGLSIPELRKNLEAAIQIIEQAPGPTKIRLVLAGMKAPPNLGLAYTRDYNRVFPELAKAHPKIVFIPFLLEGVAGERSLNQSDGIHPNEKGHEHIANLVIPYLEKYL